MLVNRDFIKSGGLPADKESDSVSAWKKGS